MVSLSQQRKNFDLLPRSKERSVVDSNHNIGSTFLPPINLDSQRQLMRIPHIKVNQDKKMTVKPEFIRNLNDSPRKHVGENVLIHSFDPTHISMPQNPKTPKPRNNGKSIGNILYFYILSAKISIKSC